MTEHTISVTLPDWMWGRLATIADQRRTTVGQLIKNSVDDTLLNDDGRLDQLDHEITQARASGWTPPHRYYKEKN